MQTTTHHSKLFFFVIIFGFFTLLLYSIFIYTSIVFAEEPKQEELRTSNQIIQTENTKIEKADILAKSYVIYDINNKKIVRGDNSHLPLPIASLTKIITIGTLLNTAKNHNIPIREETKLRIQRALIQSSNVDADSLGYVYSYSFGRDLLQDSNELISSLGIKSLTLTNLTGLDNYDGSASNVGSAEDIAKVFAFMYENYRDVFEYSKFDELETNGGTISNTNQTTNSTFGILASKTGFTYTAGGNLGVIVSPEPGKTYVIVVMGSTKEGRFVDMQKIVKLLPLVLKNQGEM